jgi:hypothetical protein
MPQVTLVLVWNAFTSAWVLRCPHEWQNSSFCRLWPPPPPPTAAALAPARGIEGRRAASNVVGGGTLTYADTADAELADLAAVVSAGAPPTLLLLLPLMMDGTSVRELDRRASRVAFDWSRVAPTVGF